MDTAAIAIEIVRIKNRIEEIDGQVAGASGTDVDDERNTLQERMRSLQDQMSARGWGDGSQDSPAQAGSVQYIPPA